MDGKRLLVMFLVLAVLTDLVLNLLTHFLVLLDLSGPSLFQLVDLFGDLGHAGLEVLGEFGALLPLLVHHLFVLQVQVMVLLEDRGAKQLQSFPLLDVP